MNQIETSVGIFELIKDDQNSLNIADFEKKFVDILKTHEYIVGDYFQEILRLKGFDKENVKRIPDYINEFCSLDSNYYILRNPNFDKNLVIEED